MYLEWIVRKKSRIAASVTYTQHWYMLLSFAWGLGYRNTATRFPTRFP